MNKQQQQVKARKDWLKIYLELGYVTKTTLRCGIARSTLYRWIKNIKKNCQISQDTLKPLQIINPKQIN